MKKEHRSRIVAFLLPVLMIFQIMAMPFLSAAAGENDEAKTEKYTIRLLIDILEKTGESSKRTVKVWKLSKDQLKKDDLLETAKHFDGMEDSKIDEELNSKGVLSEESKLDENSEKELIEIPVENKKGEESYYLIKESNESLDMMKEKIASGKSKKLVTNVVKLPNDNIKDGILSINIKNEMEVPTTNISLVKTDSKNKDIRLDKVGFRLYRKAKEEEKEDQLVSVEGKLGVYKYKASEEKITDDQVPVLKTNTNGKIEVSDLPEGETYYFKEVEPVGEYNNDNNKNKTSEDFKVGETSEIVIENDRIPFVKKVDQKGQALAGAKFEVYNKDGKKLSFKKDTDKFNYGYTYLKDSEEDKAKESEESNETKEESESSNENKEETEESDESDETKDEDSENAENTDEKITELVSDEEGNIFISDMPEGEGYYFLETEAPEGYEKSSDKFEFNVDENHIIYRISKDEEGKEIKTQGYITVENIKPDEKTQKGGFKFLKVDSSDTSKKLKGAKFKVTKKVGDKYEDVERNGKKYIVESDKNGAFEVKDLELGTYYLKETTAPSGYVVNSSPIEIEITGSSYAQSPAVVTNSKGDVPVTPTTPGGSTSTRGPKGPLVKTGDIRILVFFAAGLLLILGGYKMVRSQDKKVNRA
ncbi:SpaA isopeptide-forming pilin-related protein [uncultured Anaerococcus sp.]|uniref:MSCRAMM family protein n=1 Tax=uncultured Anaerococcus sp. TaxID=293428 RepID=UPI00280BE7EF|nr:SpaA isopeptide-forming pilin-related protein [uncultured Anaerococcus sp.]MDU5150087.1 SpaA isopeptide-forming pilin-related protein [Anaerococcus prevotii]